MAAKRKIEKNTAESTEAKFPYTTKPASLRKLLQIIPQKPKPAKLDRTLLKSWGFKDTNDATMLRVLKTVNLINDRNEPTEVYLSFMQLKDGARSLGPEIKRVYAPMFQASHTPYNEANEQLRSFFNIHSGGGERTLDFQIQTFKALCENSSFEGNAATLPSGSNNAPTNQNFAGNPNPVYAGAGVHINLHIHLPENKSRRDYETIIEDIGRYIFGRTSGEKSES